MTALLAAALVVATTSAVPARAATTRWTIFDASDPGGCPASGNTIRQLTVGSDGTMVFARTIVKAAPKHIVFPDDVRGSRLLYLDYDCRPHGKVTVRLATIGKKVRTAVVGGPFTAITQATFDGAGKRIFAGRLLGDHGIRFTVFRTRDLKRVSAETIDHVDSVTHLDSGDGGVIYLTTSEVAGDAASGTTHLIPVVAGKARAPRLTLPNQFVLFSDVSRRGRAALAGSPDGTITVQNAAGGPLRTMTVCGGPNDFVVVDHVTWIGEHTLLTACQFNLSGRDDYYLLDTATGKVTKVHAATRLPGGAGYRPTGRG